MAIVDVQNLSKFYDKRKILSDLCLTIESGEFISIVGKSGAGKSTLINILGLLDPKFIGNYKIDGIDVAKCKSSKMTFLRNKYFGFVFQMYNLINNYTVKDNILLPVLYSKNKKVDEKYYRSLLNELGIEHLENQYTVNLSGGEKQRVAIARAAINHPSVIIADEPTGNLDSDNTKNVLNMFRYLQKEEGVTTIMVTHDSNAADAADRKLCIKDGKLVQI